MNKDLFSPVGAEDLQLESAITAFHTAEVLGHEFQIYGTAKEPLFRAKDVAELLEHSNVSSMLLAVEDDEKVIKQFYTLGGMQNVWFLTEHGLYECLMLSRKSAARQFKKQVKQILTEIRTNGAYVHATPEETLEELSMRAMRGLQAAIERQKMQIEEQQKQLLIQKPDVEYTKTVLAADNMHTVNTIAVHLGISAIKLNKFLIDEGIIYKRGDLYYPSAKIRGKGYCDYHIIPYVNSQGETMTREHLKWTEAGRRFVIELYNKRVHGAA
jgi:prophage antirepressor-like protein